MESFFMCWYDGTADMEQLIFYNCPVGRSVVPPVSASSRASSFAPVARPLVPGSRIRSSVLLAHVLKDGYR